MLSRKVKCQWIGGKEVARIIVESRHPVVCCRYLRDYTAITLSMLIYSSPPAINSYQMTGSGHKIAV